MSGTWRRIVDLIETRGSLARISIVAVAGSAPREIGADLLVRPDGAFHGTIGGGALEWCALALARDALAQPAPVVERHDVVLGPDLGQCCGGRVTLLVETFDRDCLPAARRLAEAEAAGPIHTSAALDAGLAPLLRSLAEPAALGLGRNGRLVEHFGDDRRAVLLVGAGHLGRALVLALAPLPFRPTWVDERSDAFPSVAPAAIAQITGDPLAAVAAAPPGTLVVAVSHDHAVDLAVVDASLRRDDLPWVGCVGSRTKHARFSSKLLQMGHTTDAIRRMVCPIGAVGPRSKRPPVIAAAVAVELLVVDEALREGRPLRLGAALAPDPIDPTRECP